VPTRRDGRRRQAALTHGTIQGLLTYAEQARCLARAYQIGCPAVALQEAPEGLHGLWKEAAMTSRGDEGRLEPAPGDGAQNSRPADAKSIC
jgi:hypothetical protein